MVKKIAEGIFLVRNKLATKNSVPGKKVYGEQLIRMGKDEFRLWSPNRSKLGAAIKKGLKSPFKKDSKVLYLGSASGTTPSHISDIIKDGMLFGVEISARVMRDFLLLCEDRENLIPIMESANHPEKYKEYVPEIDIIFQDVAQKNQTEIFIKNAELFLKKEGIGLYAVKARSIDVSKNPKQVFREEQKKLKDNNFKVIQSIYLEPFEKDHILLIVKKK